VGSKRNNDRRKIEILIRKRKEGFKISTHGYVGSEYLCDYFELGIM
jgi:hypothetical protein